MQARDRRKDMVTLVFDGDFEREVKIHDVIDVVAITSLVATIPRLHVLKVLARNQLLPTDYVTRHFACNVLLPIPSNNVAAASPSASSSSAPRATSSFSPPPALALPTLREKALLYLRNALGPDLDALACEYVLLGLCSKVYRKGGGGAHSSCSSGAAGETSALGITPMNFVLPPRHDPPRSEAAAPPGPPRRDSVDSTRTVPRSGSSTFVQSTLTKTLKDIHPYVFPLDASLPGLKNFGPFRGAKDADTEEMTPGLLTLAQDSVLVVDETELETGTLRDEAVVNAAVLTKLERATDANSKAQNTSETN
eukprot:g13831.t1